MYWSPSKGVARKVEEKQEFELIQTKGNCFKKNRWSPFPHVSELEQSEKRAGFGNPESTVLWTEQQLLDCGKEGRRCASGGHAMVRFVL